MRRPIIRSTHRWRRPIYSACLHSAIRDKATAWRRWAHVQHFFRDSLNHLKRIVIFKPVCTISGSYFFFYIVHKQMEMINLDKENVVRHGGARSLQFHIFGFLLPKAVPEAWLGFYLFVWLYAMDLHSEQCIFLSCSVCYWNEVQIHFITYSDPMQQPQNLVIEVASLQ